MRHWMSMAAAVLVAMCGTQAQAQMTEFVAISGIARGEQVSMRSGPSTGNAVIAWADEGETLRNQGCTRGNPSWCRLEILSGDAAGQIGWIADRYLAPAAPPATRFGRAEPRYAPPPPPQLAPPSPPSGRNDAVAAAQPGVTYNTKCAGNSKNCLQDARLYCRGDYHVLESESYFGSADDDARAGPVNWYSLNFRCGAGPGVFPNFPRRS